MILDKLENSNKYNFQNNRFVKAFKFLTDTDLLDIDEGRYEIDGDDVYAIVSNYLTKESAGNHPEVHRKYADIQYIVKGEENIGYSIYTSQAVYKEYNTEKDCLLYDDVSCFFLLKQGILRYYPDDLHMPGIMNIEPRQVKKVVIKVRI